MTRQDRGRRELTIVHFGHGIQADGFGKCITVSGSSRDAGACYVPKSTLRKLFIMLRASSVLPHSKKLKKTDFKDVNHVILRN